MTVAVVGTRHPNEVQRERCREAVQAALGAGHRIVTGGAPGIDTIAVHATQVVGHPERVTLVLPWERFEGWQDLRLRRVVFDPEEHAGWLHEARRLHPAPERVSRGAWLLLARDAGIATMADLVLAFPQGGDRGGTAFTCRAARGLGKPVHEDVGHPRGGADLRRALEALSVRSPVAAATR